MPSFKESEIIAEHQAKQAAEKATQEKAEPKKETKEVPVEITVPHTAPDVMRHYLKYYLNLEDITEREEKELDDIYIWASKNTKGITPDDILDTLDLLGERLGIMRFGENKFKTFYQYVRLNNVKNEAEQELKSLENRWNQIKNQYDNR